MSTMTATTPTPTPTPIVALATTATASTTACAPRLYDIPVINPACVMPQYSTYHILMASCCGAAPVLAILDCSYYCLARGQTVGDLAHCLIEGSRDGQVWCNANANRTATEAATITVTGLESEPENVASETAMTTTDEELRGSFKINGVQEKTISVVTALLLLLMVVGGVVRPVP
ncbi:hypothetical protein BJX62DRAFT_243598 [Aspergillus germanicus]